jgi:hypothetical protein
LVQGLPGKVIAKRVQGSYKAQYKPVGNYNKYSCFYIINRRPWIWKRSTIYEQQ